MLTLKKGGVLIHQHSEYDEVKEKRKNVTKDVTKTATGHLFEECNLVKGITLRDIFLLLQRDLDFYDNVFGNWCKEIVEDAFANQSKPSEDFLHLELYTTNMIYKVGKKHNGDSYQFPSFHAWGIHQGSESGYSLLGQEVGSLLDLPVKLKGSYLSIHDEPANEKGKTWREYEWNVTYNLGQILYGIIWELSYHGSPSMKKEKDAEILGACFEAIEAYKKDK